MVKPLVWLGEENVLLTVHLSTAEDPVRATIARVVPLMHALIEQMGTGTRGVMVSDMLGVADSFDGGRQDSGPAGVHEAQRSRRDAFGEATKAKQYDGVWQLEGKRSANG